MKRLTVFGWLLVMVCSLLVACGGEAVEEGPKGDAVAGKVQFEASCISCHGMDGTGLPGLGKDLTTSVFTSSLPDADLVTFIKTGRPVSDPANTTKVDMPPKGGNPVLTDEDLLNIVAYIRTLQK